MNGRLLLRMFVAVSVVVLRGLGLRRLHGGIRRPNRFKTKPIKVMLLVFSQPLRSSGFVALLFSVTHTWSLEMVWSLEWGKQGAEKRQADSTAVNRSLQIEGKSQLWVLCDPLWKLYSVEH